MMMKNERVMYIMCLVKNTDSSVKKEDLIKHIQRKKNGYKNDIKVGLHSGIL
jgi:hypothetical protein